MIQDIKPYRYRLDYENRGPQGGDVALLYQGNQVLLRETEGETNPLAALPFCGELPGMDFQYLFAMESPSGKTIRFFLGKFSRGSKEGEEEKELAQRLHAGWYRDTRVCSRCGRPLKHSKTERMLFCPDCGLQQYPRISPAVIVAVTNGNKLLMTKYAGRAYTRYALIAGFAETGETIEETVHREVLEEVGVRVKNVKFYKSQPWSLTSTLLFGFYAELDGSDEIKLEDGELSVGQWMTREEIEEDENQESLTWEMIERFKHGEV